MAFNKKVKETYHFPQNIGNTNRLMNTASEDDMFLGKTLVEKNDNEKVFNVYPNPNHGNFTLSYQFESNNGVQIEMLNLTGKIVYKETLIENRGKLSLNTNLPVGIYLIIIKDNKQQLLYLTKVGVIK